MVLSRFYGGQFLTGTGDVERGMALSQCQNALATAERGLIPPNGLCFLVQYNRLDEA
jgi:hypothetical protein